MRLVKRGTKGDKKWRATCGGCGAEFEALESELNVEYDRDGSLARAKCTECGDGMFFYAADGSSSRSTDAGAH
jgi:ribosomal protein S27AE